MALLIHRYDDELQEAIRRRGYAMVPVSALRPNPLNPRQAFDETALAELTDSIRVFGVLEPLLVTPTGDGELTVVAGERRRRAAVEAGLVTVPVIIQEHDRAQQMAIMLLENLQRADLNPLEEARGIKQLLDECAMTQEALAKQLGKSQPWVANRLRLLRLPESVLEKVQSGELSAGHAQILLKYEQAPELIERAAGRIIKDDIPVAMVEKSAISPSVSAQKNENYRAFGYNQEFVARGCGKCKDYRVAGWQKLCFNPECFDRKQAEAQETKQAEAGGLTIAELRESKTPFAESHQLRQARDAQCETCDKRRKAKPSYGVQLEEICLDLDCCKRKIAAAEKSKRAKALAAMNAELAQIRAVADEAAAGLEPKHLALVLMELLRIETDRRRHYEAGKEWPTRKQLLGHYFGRSWPAEDYWGDNDLGSEKNAGKVRSLAQFLLTHKPAKLAAALVEWALLSGIEKLGPVLEIVGMGEARQEAAAALDAPEAPALRRSAFPPALTLREPPWPQECPDLAACKHWCGEGKGCDCPDAVCPFAPKEDEPTCPHTDHCIWSGVVGQCNPADEQCQYRLRREALAVSIAAVQKAAAK